MTCTVDQSSLTVSDMTTTQQEQAQQSRQQEGSQSSVQQTVQVVQRMRDIVISLSHQKELVLLRLTALTTRTQEPNYKPSQTDLIEQGDVNGRMAALDFSIDQICDALGTNIWEVLSSQPQNQQHQQKQNQPL